jgi:hypothetical protein
MLQVAEAHSPKRMKDTGFFMMVPDGTLNGSANKFAAISATTKGLTLIENRSAVMGMVRSSKATKEVMFYEENWEDNNFYRPVQRLISGVIARR